MFQILLTIVLCQFRIIPAEATDSEGSMCPSVVYLKVGSEGQIPCTCGSFTIVAWYWKEEYDNRGSPIINYDKVQKTGSGYSSGEYDIAENGSLIISSVMRHHEGNFVVTVADDFQHREDTIFIQVIVVVPAAPPYPVVNDKVNQQHVYMDVNRNGTLRCAMFGVYPDVNLTFTSESDKIIFQHDSVLKTPLQNNTFDVTFNMHYIVTDLTLKRLTIFCKVADDNIAEQFPDKTKVDLLFLPVYPVVNGYVNQDHVYLDANREGQLNCLKEKVEAGTSLTWEVVGSSLEGKVSVESAPPDISSNYDGTSNINQIINYTADYSVDRIHLLCKVIQRDTENVFATKVDLLFENVYPMVNGHVNQNHVYLDVERMGQLTCVKENVIAGTTLDWVLDSDLHGKVVFQSRTITLINSDGTVNINQTFDYDILDNSLDRITLECRVIEPESVEHPFTTTVELLFSSVLPPFSDPVISGCYHQKHDCVLEVERSGELTCTVKNSHYPVDLKWTTLGGDKEYLVFGKTRVKSYNSTDLYDVSITTSYTVVDKSVTSVTVQCDAWRSDSSGQVLAVGKTSLKMTDCNTNNSTWGAVFAEILTVFLVIALGLLVLILWYKNRKMHKKFAVKFLKPILDMHTHNEYTSPEEGTNGTALYCTPNGGPVVCSDDVCDASRQEVQDINESLESPDSGNSGSNSRESSGSEASEKSGLMDDIEMSCNNSKQDPLHVNREGFEDTPMV